MAKGFLVQSVAIEGFKGFTKRKEIDFDGRHAFLLGQNGNGKSSIIEAVRWGLFGSTRRPNEVVANRAYGARCRVDLTLISEGTKWHFRRTLNRGTTGGSDAVLTDEHGQEHPIQAIMPQLDSVDAGEGMHIIFAPQSTPLRRQPEDLTAFERTVFNHLGLTHPRSLLSQLRNLLDDQELVEKDLGERLTNARHDIDSDIDRLVHQRGIILGAPPWDGDRSPTVAQSEIKVRDLLTEITGKSPDETLSGLSLDALIDTTEDALTERRNQGQGGLESEMSVVATRRERFEDLLAIQKNIEDCQSDIQGTNTKLATVLQGISVDELRDSIAESRTTASGIALRRQIVDATVSLLHREQSETASCPVCEVIHNRQDFETALHTIKELLSDELSSDIPQLEAHLRQAEESAEEIQRLTNLRVDLQRNVMEVRDSIDDEQVKVSGDISATDLVAIINRCSDHEASIKDQIDSQEIWFSGKRALLSKMNEESRYHQIQKDLEVHRSSKNRFDRIETAYQNLVSFGESVRAIWQALSSSLNERLKEDLPSVSENLSQVFAGLTNHPWYDRLTIPSETLPRLELRVSSSQDPSGGGHPTGVLNGQAESALALVPYFAFSGADDNPTEVYLVMLDDPTRASDEEHIRNLIARLADLGHNVQLMVASHETREFRELLPKNFEPASYVIIEPTGWSYHNGPELNIECG